MKIYRHKGNNRIVGAKFEDLASTQVTMTATGNLAEDGVTIDFAYRNRKNDGDFNADPLFVKDYDLHLDGAFAQMIDLCDRDKAEGRFELHHLAPGDSIAKVKVTASEQGTGFDDLVRNLMCILTLAVNT